MAAKSKGTGGIGSDAAQHARGLVEKDATLAALVEAELSRLALAAKVKALREKRHLTQAELAERVGTAQPNIARLESGRATPRLDLLARIAAALGARLDVTLTPART